MSWKKHLAAVPQGQKLQAAIDRMHANMDNEAITGTSGKFTSYLPEVYSGQDNRIERYGQYLNMDKDPAVNAALDTISYFCTQTEEESPLMFKIDYFDNVTDAETEVLQASLRKWTLINKFKQRLFGIFRKTIMYGDQFFIRDPETFELHWVNHENVDKIIVDEAQGKKLDQFIVRDLDLNLQTLVATQPRKGRGSQGPTGWAGTPKAAGPVTVPSSAGGYGTRFDTGQGEYIDANHVVQFSLSDGQDANWPFGSSILESVFKPYKQKELIEDAVIIYRVQRAPERRVFYIDTGNAPPHKAMEFVNRISNEIHQRRIPTQTGGGSTIMDAAYNPLCLALDTTIPLLDGRTLKLEELITEYNQGKENWTYSCDPITGKIVPGNITWAGITRKNTQVIKLNLDDGTSITLTPDHKVPVLGKGFVEAQHLTKNDSLISYETREKSLVSSDNDRTYTQIYDHEQNEWVYVHRLVNKFFRDINKHQEFTYLPENINSHKSVVHHKDFNRYNNDPRNLQLMNHLDHIRYHQDTNFWQHISEKEAERIKLKISKTLKNRWENITDDEKRISLKNIRKAQQQAVWLRNNDNDHATKYAVNFGKARREKIKNDPDFKKRITSHLTNWQENMPNQRKNYTQKMLQLVIDVVRENDSNRVNTAKILNENGDILNEIKLVNPVDPKKNNKIGYTTFTPENLDGIISNFGYKGWKDFKSKINVYNHRITSIEWLDEKQDTGTITIDGKEKWHNYHTFPVNNSIFVKNSMIDDYFFPQTAEGRGSKVETLPGGDSLGEIDDLKYFNNRMLDGLRVPRSYISTGPDENQGGLSDGKLGMAYMQDFSFGKYCGRIQDQLNPTFDREFKLFLKDRGIQVDSGMFQIELHTPQNFSKYRQIEADSAQISVFQPLADVPYLSKRFLMKRFLNLSDEEILENEELWREENEESANDAMGINTGGGGGGAAGVSGLSAVGIRPDEGGEDIDTGEELEGTESPISGGEAGEVETGEEAPEVEL